MCHTVFGCIVSGLTMSAKQTGTAWIQFIFINGPDPMSSKEQHFLHPFHQSINTFHSDDSRFFQEFPVAPGRHHRKNFVPFSIFCTAGTLQKVSYGISPSLILEYLTFFQNTSLKYHRFLHPSLQNQDTLHAEYSKSFWEFRLYWDGLHSYTDRLRYILPAFYNHGICKRDSNDTSL